MMAIRVLSTDLHILDMKTRMPFKYGIATLTALPHLMIRVTADVDGTVSTGIAADGLPPKWFTKNPEQPFRDEIDAMLAVVSHACDVAGRASERSSVFDLWRDIYAAQEQWAVSTDYPPLLWAFGVTLVERALIDAFCRAKGITFAEAVRSNALGVRLGDVHPELDGTAPADYLPQNPLREIAIRHTVGLADPITPEDIFAEDLLDDGLPQSLDQVIADYGVSLFKIKVNGHLEGDLERLRTLALIIDEGCGNNYRFSLDGNEQFHDVATFRAFWDAANRDPAIQPFLSHLLFVEQPVHRSRALSDEVGAELLAWEDRPPMIIDESDGALTSLRDALDRGYRGTSHKNCKGVFKGIANRCLIEHLRRAHPEETYVMSAEDLANVGPVALMQDLAVLATLGIENAERNGHHYFRGLSMLPGDLQRNVLATHPDAYRRHPDGYPTLAISGGVVPVGSVVDAPFGVASDIDPSRFVPVADWTPDGLGDV